MASVSRPAAIAVLDVGRTNAELLAITPDGAILASRQAPNAVHSGAPYPHCDTEHLWRWMMAALADLGERFAIRAIVPTSYGSTAALVGDAELVLPVLDYEAEPPAEIAAAYAEIAPWFEECFCPISPAGLTLGRQLFWQSPAVPGGLRPRALDPAVPPVLGLGALRRAGQRGDLARRPDPALKPARARFLEPGQAPGLARQVAAAARCLGRARALAVVTSRHALG